MITHQAIIEELKLRLRDELKLEITEDETLESSEDEDENKQKIPGWKLSQVARELKPDSFRELSREKDKHEDKKCWTGWFLGDGDGAGKYFESLKSLKPEEEAVKTKEFSREMRNWGKDLRINSKKYLQDKGRMIYAGGDDFLGVLYKPNQQIPALDCLQWFYTFKSGIWQQPQTKKISASVGFVWAGNQVPQRDVLQHCHLAESSAKSTGRDRIAFRILFNSGNSLEWVCPWWVLDDSDRQKFANKDMPILPETSQNLIESYHDRDKGKNWTHFYQDVAILESRHAFSEHSIDIALGLLDIYFGSDWKEIIGNQKNWWNRYDENELQIFTGILGDPKSFKPDKQETREMKVLRAFNNWVINLAKVGFQLTDNNGRTN
ncbi:MAG: hypothetical protein HC820_03525 [Hydrococcus sp. RM1_1_31]|nr:hypothetical protein [Hydrococcus sp. RM1_1_31]